MDFDLPEELQLLQSSVRDYVASSVAPYAAKLDENEEFPVDQIKAAAELGLMGITIPEEYGGNFLGTLGSTVVVEEVSRVCPSTAVTISVHNSLACVPLVKFGKEETKRRYLPLLARGECLGAYALSEADAGSDAANLRTRAERKGDRWVINGAKMWITSGTHADLVIVYARTSVDPSKRSRGVTAFLVEKQSKGFRVGKKEDKLGIRASSTTELHFEDCEVPAENVIGEVDKGFRVAMDTLDGGRIGIAAQAVGIAQGCLDESLKYARERQQFGRAIAEYQAIQWKLADMATHVDAARLMTRRAALLRDQAKPCTKEAAMAKLFASQLSNRAADDAVQIHGSAGYSRDYLVERLFRDARITEIYEGTTEVQRMVIARELLD